MGITSQEITVVFQGALPNIPDGQEGAIRTNIEKTRRALPGCEIVLSTWDGAPIPPDLKDVTVVLSPDPGALPSLKITDPHPNNINRQIVSSREGVNNATKPYTLKLRTDSYLEHGNFLQSLNKLFSDEAGFGRRIVVTTFFTLDPRMFERIPYHVSDWVQFARTDVLQKLWSVPLMTKDEATYYDRTPHPSSYNYFEKKFRARFGVEQHIYMIYAKALGYTPPAELHDTNKKVLSDSLRFIADETVILSPSQIGFCLEKYEKLNRSLFQSLNCVTPEDWFFYAKKAEPKAVAIHLGLKTIPLILLHFPFARQIAESIIARLLKKR